MHIPVAITINGRVFQRDVEPRLLLVHFLRDIAQLTGTKVGCDTSQCGSCTVLVDGLATKSCTRLAAQADGSSITTIEGLAQGSALHRVQEAFWTNHGLQCGFCSPGMILTAVAMLKDTPHPSAAAVRHGLEGNLCRCTGYQNIVKSICDAASVGGRA